MKNKYLQRSVDKEIDKRIKAFVDIQLIGSKGCGKTRTAKERCKTVFEFEDEDKSSNYLSLANSFPSSFLKYETPILFDE